PLDLAVFPGTDHGILEFAASGAERVMLRHPDGSFRLVVDWLANQDLRGAYGSAPLEPATRGQPADAATTDAPAQPVGAAAAHWGDPGGIARARARRRTPGSKPVAQ